MHRDAARAGIVSAGMVRARMIRARRALVGRVRAGRAHARGYASGGRGGMRAGRVPHRSACFAPVGQVGRLVDCLEKSWARFEFCFSVCVCKKSRVAKKVCVHRSAARAGRVRIRRARAGRFASSMLGGCASGRCGPGGRASGWVRVEVGVTAQRVFCVGRSGGGRPVGFS